MIETAAGAPSLQARELSRRFGNGRGVGPVTLQVAPGEVQAIVGPNGSGKTTLLRCLATRSRPSSGELIWFGSPDPRAARHRLAVVFDATAHADELSSWDNLSFFATARGVPPELWEPALRQSPVLEVADDPISRLSYGMRRRVLLDEALVGSPQLLLLDEPTLGLDVSARQWLVESLRGRAREGLASCVSTNDTDFVEQVATRVCFLLEGRVLRNAPLQELLAELGGTREIRISYRGPSPRERLLRVEGVEQASETEGGLLVLARQREGLLAALLAALGELDRSLLDLTVRDPGLADCFLRLSGRALDG